MRDRVKELRRVRAADIHGSPWNWREHGDGQRAATKSSLEELGIFEPLDCYEKPDGTLWLFDGHLRQEILEGVGPDTMVPVIVTDLDEAEAKKANVVKDPLASMAEANQEALGELMAGLETESEALREMLEGMAAEYDIDVFEEAVPPEDPGPQIDRAAELQKEWKTELGQLWEIPGKAGVHRVLCGDCRNADDMQRLCTEKVQGVFTSPPYAEQRKEQYGGVPVDKYIDWWEAVQVNIRAVLRDDGSFFVNIKPHCEDGERVLYVFDLVLAMKRRWNWRFVEELCWRNSGIPGKPQRRFKNQFEPVYQFAIDADYQFRPTSVMHSSEREFHTADGNLKSMQGQPGCDMSKNAVFVDGQAFPGNVIAVNVDSHRGAGSGHAAAFPVGLPAFFVKAYSDESDTWLDPFLGSGTTIVACEQLGRIGYGIEIEPKYVAVTLQRLKDMGLEPRLTTR